MIKSNKILTVVMIFAGPIYSFSVQAADAATLYHERACVACHGAEGRYPAMDDYPKLAAQSESYLLAQMKDIKNGSRSNAHSVAMSNMMHLISDEEMADVAKWLAGLPEK